MSLLAFLQAEFVYVASKEILAISEGCLQHLSTHFAAFLCGALSLADRVQKVGPHVCLTALFCTTRHAFRLYIYTLFYRSSSCTYMHRLEAIAIRLEATAIRLEAITIRLDAGLRAKRMSSSRPTYVCQHSLIYT